VRTPAVLPPRSSSSDHPLVPRTAQEGKKGFTTRNTPMVLFFDLPIREKKSDKVVYQFFSCTGYFP